MTSRPDENYIAEPVGEPAAAGVPGAAAAPARRSRKRIVLAALIALLVVVAAVLGFMLYKGALAPASAAAKYDLLSYISEEEVTEYVETYRTQVGCADDDETWGQFLAAYGMTPELLRAATVRQLIIDDEVAKAAKKAGISVSSEELDSYVELMKGNLAFGDDTIWEQTLSNYGQTEEGLREAYTRTLLEEKLFEANVPVPEASRSDVLSYLESALPTGGSYKHIYYLTVEGLDEGSSYEKLANVQKIRSMLLESGEVTAETFGAFVSAYCTDDELVARGGANGWSIDMADYSEAYQGAVTDTKVGEVSPVFKDTNGYSFVWIDTKYKLPDISAELGTDDFDGDAYLDDIPETLFQYFSDLAARELWADDCQDYLNELYEQSNPVVFGMPAGLSYAVDMTPYYSEQSDE